MAFEFQLPDIGEGLTEGEIVKWLVREGDSVRENQPLVNVLTDKAEVEIPSPKNGRILRILAKEGQKVAVHSVIVEIEVSGGDSAPAPALGGHAARPGAAATLATPPRMGAPLRDGTLATPGVRKLAQDLRVDLSALRGTGPGGRITEEDVRQASGGSKTAAAETGPAERIAYKGIRRRTGEKMAQSLKTAAHVTHVDEADVTELAALRAELKPEAERKGVKLTYMPFVLRALVKALKEFPYLNATLDDSREEIVLKKYYNIGIAVTSEHGLYVPVVKTADQKDLWTLAKEIADLADKARANKLGLAELQGGTFTVTNIGPIGGLFATPIINHPETGILGIMKVQERAAVRDGKIEARKVMNLALSFDHRVLDGAEAAAFMNALIKQLEEPRSLI